MIRPFSYKQFTLPSSSHFLNSLFSESACKLRRAEAGCNSPVSEKFSQPCSSQRLSPPSSTESDTPSTVLPSQRTVNCFTNPKHSRIVSSVHDPNFLHLQMSVVPALQQPLKSLLPLLCIQSLVSPPRRGCSWEVSLCSFVSTLPCQPSEKRCKI